MTPSTIAHQGSSVYGILQARIPEWVAMPFSRRSSLPRDWTQVSCIEGRLFTIWATREHKTQAEMKPGNKRHKGNETISGESYLNHVNISMYISSGEGNGTPLQYSCLGNPMEPGRLQSMGSPRVGHDWETSLSLFTFMHWRRKWQPIPVFLPRESQGWQSLVGFHLWCRTGSDMTKAT